MADPADDAYTTAKPSRFHFKSSSSRRKRHHDHDDDDDKHRSSKRHRSSSPSRHSHRSRRKHHHSHSDRHPTSTTDGSYYSPTNRHRESLFDEISEQDISQNDRDAFRESLFDALADDEGAAYWEAVYGQPVNVYPTAKPGPDGKLERMTDDEYAEYVRARMWEKTHQHIVEEREAREQARRERKERERVGDEEWQREEREREGIRRQMEESLRRGEERKRAKEARKSWDAYAAKWEALGQLDAAADDIHIRDLIPWPTLSGNSKHIDKHEIERFLRAAPAWKEDPAALLKLERVRWHPDKMQRRFGTRIDEATIRDVTAVFQVVDQMWNARR